MEGRIRQHQIAGLPALALRLSCALFVLAATKTSRKLRCPRRCAMKILSESRGSSMALSRARLYPIHRYQEEFVDSSELSLITETSGSNFEDLDASHSLTPLHPSSRRAFLNKMGRGVLTAG